MLRDAIFLHDANEHQPKLLKGRQTKIVKGRLPHLVIRLKKAITIVRVTTGCGIHFISFLWLHSDHMIKDRYHAPCVSVLSKRAHLYCVAKLRVGVFVYKH